MNDLTNLTQENLEAEQREREHLRQRIFELEAILDIPHADTSIDTFYFLRRRLRNLQAQVVADPDDDNSHTMPIILGDWLAEHQA